MSNKDSILILKSHDGRAITVRDKDIVGRTSVGGDILEGYEGVSRQHAQFLSSEGGWFVVDLGTVNGTTLNGQRVTPRKMTSIREGDTIALTKGFSATAIFDRREYDEVESEAASAVSETRPIMTVMFVDLKGSTDYFQEKGTMVASSWINNFYKMLQKVVTQNEGRHIKNIGDAILAVFNDPIKASHAAVMMQQGSADHNKNAQKEDHYYIRIGMNIGPVLYENKDVFGNVVNISARIQSLAPAGKTYISEPIYEILKDNIRFATEFVNHEALRGVKEKMGIYELKEGFETTSGNTVTIKS